MGCAVETLLIQVGGAGGDAVSEPVSCLVCYLLSNSYTKRNCIFFFNGVRRTSLVAEICLILWKKELVFKVCVPIIQLQSL